MTGRKTADRNQENFKRLALILTGLGLLALGAVALIFLLNPGEEAPVAEKNWNSVVPQQVNFPAPELNLMDLNGNPVSLSALTGQVVLLNNWAFWCPPCRDELPELQAYYDQRRQQGFTIIGVEAGDEKKDVLYHVNLFKLSYPIWLDPDKATVIAFRNNTLPNSYVIDRTGQVRLAWSGAVDRAMLEKYVTPLLEE